jgi:membrane protease YdiL (CAAX protease family)
VGLVVGSLLGAVPVVAAIRNGADPGVPALFAALVLTMVGYALVGGLYSRRYLPVTVRVPTRRDLLCVAWGLVGAFAGIVVLGLLVFSLGPEGTPNGVGVVGVEAPVFSLAVALLSILLVGPAEGLLFRGAVQGRLHRASGPAGAIVGASLPFGSIHAVAVAGMFGATLVSVGLISVVSLVLGYLYEGTGNLVIPALVYGFYK